MTGGARLYIARIGAPSCQECAVRGNMRLRSAINRGMGDKMIYVRLLVFVSMLSTLSGCVGYYIPGDYTPSASRPLEPITEFSSTSSVSLQNGQNSKESANVTTGVYANLNAWTDVAMEIASRELKKRGLVVTGGALKTITMAIQSAKSERGWTDMETQISMHVTTSDGYSANYIGRNSSAVSAILHRQIDGAMMRVVREMLIDPHIVAFLTK
jgi:hypothetical protein